MNKSANRINYLLHTEGKWTDKPLSTDIVKFEILKCRETQNHLLLSAISYHKFCSQTSSELGSEDKSSECHLLYSSFPSIYKKKKTARKMLKLLQFYIFFFLLCHNIKNLSQLVFCFFNITLLFFTDSL